MRLNKRHTLVAAIALLVVSANAHANWIDGQGVVFFPSTNKEKIIYKSNVSPYNGEQSLATDSTDYNKYKAYIGTSTRPLGSPVPSGYTPGTNWQAANLTPSSILFAEGLWVFKNVATGTSQPEQCGAGVACGEVTMSFNKDSCSTRDIAYSFSGASTWKPKIKWLTKITNILSGVTAGTTLSTCTGKTQSYTCYSGSENSPYAVDTFATIEARARFGYGKLTPEDGRIDEGTDGKTVKNVCAAAGGTYRWDTIDGTSYCTDVKDKVYRHQYELWPILDRPTAAACRIVRIN